MKELPVNSAFLLANHDGVDDVGDWAGYGAFGVRSSEVRCKRAGFRMEEQF